MPPSSSSHPRTPTSSNPPSTSHTRTPSTRSARHSRSISLTKTAIHITIYDLLPPGRLSTTLWYLGTSLLHTGIRINSAEYAFGGHDRPGVTGVYHTKPHLEPPGGTFRTEILHGFTYATDKEVDEIVKAASREFEGPGYNLLTRNCNHFTSYLCERLTGKPAPGWINRAAAIGVALPCVVPTGWVEPPECEVEEEVGLARWEEEEEEEGVELEGRKGGRGELEVRRSEDVKDAEGRVLPESEGLRLEGYGQGRR